MQYKIDKIKNFKKWQRWKIKQIKEIVENSFYSAVKSKTIGNKVLNNYIKPTIKKLLPHYNSEV